MFAVAASVSNLSLILHQRSRQTDASVQRWAAKQLAQAAASVCRVDVQKVAADLMACLT